MNNLDLPILPWDDTTTTQIPPLTWDILPDLPPIPSPDEWPAPIHGY